MGIILVGIVGPGQQAAGINRTGYRHHGFALGKLAKDIFHLCFEKEAVMEDDLGFL